jgi:hypothetical protein
MSRRVTFCLSLLAACLACASPSDDQGWYVDGVPVADNPWRGHDGPFLAMLVLTDDPESVYDFWNTKPGNVPASSITHIAPGASVEAIVFFVGCEPDRHGNCGVWGTATVRSPDGSLLADGMEVPLWVGRPPPPGRALGISEHGIGMSNESLPGSYIFRMVVTDRIANRQVSLQRELTIAQ